MLWTIFATLVITFVSTAILYSFMLGTPQNPLFGRNAARQMFDLKWKPRIGDKLTDYLAVLMGLIFPIIGSVVFWIVMMWGNIWGDWF